MQDYTNLLLEKKVLIIGCGGLGGFVLEFLSRMSIGEMLIFDDDVFSTSNLNRQILSSKSNIGLSKVEVAKKHIEDISISKVTVFEKRFDLSDEDKIKEVDVVVDCTDNIASKILIEELCIKNKKPLVFAGINGLYGQIGVSMGNKSLVKSIYPLDTAKEKHQTISYIPSFAASIQASEVYKILTNEKSNLINNILFFDLQSNTFQIVKG